MIREPGAKALTHLSAITTLGSADEKFWEGFWPGLVTRFIVELDELGDDEASMVLLTILAEMSERLVPPMTPVEEYELACARFDKANSRATALRHAAQAEQLAAEAEFLAAQRNLSRFEQSPGIPLPQYDPLREEADDEAQDDKPRCAQCGHPGGSGLYSWEHEGIPRYICRDAVACSSRIRASEAEGQEDRQS